MEKVKFDLKLFNMKILFSVFLFTFSIHSFAQDTFSIVAADSSTREVGSAGASCVDLIAYGIADPSFLGDLLPDTGAINTQASYLASNQRNARTRMRAGDDPAQVISWLVANDAGGNPNPRQYGIAGFTGQAPSSAAYTGSTCMSYANHITGNINGIYYSIQGNILLNQSILDSMESKFRKAEGDLACRLMASLQGAKIVGADTRCTSNGTSSLFAFVKVSKPSDAYGNPSFSVGVRTQNNAQIEPIDSLQAIFDIQKSCFNTGIKNHKRENNFSLFPNPATDEVTLKTIAAEKGNTIKVVDLSGRVVISEKIKSEITVINISALVRGYYLVQFPGKQPQALIKK